MGLREGRRRRIAVERSQDSAILGHPLVDLDDLGEQGRGAADIPRENVRAVLIADRQRIAEAARDRQQHRLAFAL